MERRKLKEKEVIYINDYKNKGMNNNNNEFYNEEIY